MEKTAAIRRLPLGNSGYLIPNTPETREKFEWLATTIRSHGGDASVVEVQAIDNHPQAILKDQFVTVREREYRDFLAEVRATGSASPARISILSQRLLSSLCAEEK